MNVTLALNMTHAGITLLHDSGAGWWDAGEARFEDPDFNARLAELHDTARALGGAGFETRLILPPSEVLVISSPANAGPGTGNDAQVRAALEGATPYPVTDLAFDWRKKAGTLQIAVVAHETLDEAENFATQNGFNPVSFSGVVDADAFTGAPFFGLTRAAAGRDPHEVWSDIPIKAAGSLEKHDIERLQNATVPLDSTPQNTPEPSIPDADTGDNTPAVVPAFSSIRAATPAAALTKAVPATDTPTALTADAKSQPASVSMPPPPRAIDVAAPPTPPALRAENDDTRQTKAPGGPVATSQEFAARIGNTARPRNNVTPPQISGHKETPGRAAGSNPKSTAVKPAATEAESLTVFGARDAQNHGAAPRHFGLILTLLLLLVLGAIAVWSSLFLPDTISKWFDRSPSSRTDPIETLALAAPSFAPNGTLAEGLSQTQPQVPERPVASLVASPDSSLVSSLESSGFQQPAALSGDPQTIALDQAPKPDPADLGVASNDVSLPTAVFTAPPTLPNTVPTTPATRLASLDAMTLTPEELADNEPDTLLSEDMTDPEQIVRAYAETGIWQAAPERRYRPREDSLDDLYVASIDPAIVGQDAVDLPRDIVINTDSSLPRPATPAPPDTAFALGGDGLVVPTPEGTLSPDGIFVFSGRPLVVPPGRNSSVNAPLQDTPDTLAGISPRERPDNLLEEAEKLQLGGRTRSELAALAPRARPASIQSAVQVALAEQADEDADLRLKAEAEAQAAAQSEASGTASALAVAISAAPKSRPRALELAAARQNRTTQQDILAGASTAAPNNAAAVSRSQRLQPKTPTPKSVAARATVKDAIRLNKVNLIGIYGSASNRRALVRLSSGRYIKVEVGDRVDGGKVAAIGETELRYEKSGRDVVLKLPKDG
ncbi:MAG: hypothetical protein ACI9IV_001738 [Paracoccaceae bacterium]|jgi:hypothetical protein